MRHSFIQSLVVFGLISTLAVACGKKDKDESDDADDPSGVASTGVGAGGSTTVASATSVADFKLSQAFNINLPDSLEGGGSGAALNLLAGLHSQEACQMGSTIKEVTSRLSDIGNFFCHMEVERNNILFGKKYKIVFSGQEFGRVFVDNSRSAEGIIELGFCGSEGSNKHKQLITISGLSSAGPMGSVTDAGSFTEGAVTSTWAGSISFDASTAGTMVIAGKQKFSGDGSNVFRRSVELTLRDTGLSIGTLASNGTWQGNSFEERGAAKFDGTYGSALFMSTGTHDAQTYSWTRRAHFDADGLVVAAGASADFADGGALHVASTEVPAFLAADFSPDSPAGWVGSDCELVDEEITLNPDSAEHLACDGSHQENHPDCWDQTKYESGTQDAL